MARVITFSRTYPSYHPKKGQPTYFVEKFNKSLDPFKYGFAFGKETEEHFDKLGIKYSHDIFKSCKPKHHTIRDGHKWSVGEYFSPRTWGTDINPKSKRSGPYHSKQIIIGPDTEIVKIFDFKIVPGIFYIDNKSFHGETEADFELLEQIAENDGLDRHDLLAWFKHPKPFEGQIICWNKDVNY